MRHGTIAKLPRSKATVLAGLVLFSSHALASLSAEEKVSEGKEPSASKEERLKERDRYAQETAKLRKEGKIQEAIEACEKMLAIEREVLGDFHEEVVGSLGQLAEMQEALGDFDAAEKHLREVLSIREKLHGKDHWRVTEARIDLEDLKRRSELPLGERSKFMEAQKLDAQVIALWQKGRSRQALPLAKGVVAIWEKLLGKGSQEYAESLNNLALVYKAMGDYAHAEPLYRQALEIKEKTLGEEHPNYAASLNNLATLYQATGDYARAEPLFRQTLEIKEKALGEEHPDYAGSLNNLAGLYNDMADYARAEPLYRQALEIRKKALGEEHPDYATSLNNLAVLYSEIGDYARAEPLYRQDLEITRKVLGEEHPDYATSLNNLAGLYHATGDYARAEPLFRQTIEIQKKTLGEEHPNYAMSLSNLAGLYSTVGDYARAEPLLRQALKIFRRTLELASSIQSERQQIAMAGSLRGALDAYFSIASRAGLAGAKPYEELLLWKGAVYARQRRQRLERSRPELRSLFLDLETVSNRLAALAFSAPDPRKAPAWKGQIQELTDRKEQLEGELSSKCAEYAREKALGRLSPANLQGVLPHDMALVDFLVYTEFSRQEAVHFPQASRSEAEATTEPKAPGDAEAKPGALGASKEAHKSARRKDRHLAAFVILKGAPIVELDLGPLAPIEEAVAAWRGAVASDRDSRREVESAAILRRSLWEPLESHLAGARVVLVSPDGALGRLPLGALPGSKAGTYLIEEVSIALLPVPQMLPELLAGKKPGDSASSLLLVGDVDFDAGSPGPDLTAAQRAKDGGPKEESILRGEVREAPRGDGLFNFKPLDSTRGEILMVADTFEAACRGGKLSRLRGGDASEAAVREAAAKHEFIHLATHGFFAPEELKSALAPSKAEGMERPDTGLGPGGNVTGWHPGLLSGIVLAGANAKPDPERDDGILTALELATLDLSRTELMVLSACETGLGATAGGEGLLGLQRAAQMAGARTVTASLWKVDDVDTQTLMARFYENLWKKKMGKLEALREAQLAMLRGDLGRGAGGVVPRSEGKPQRLPPRAWAAWVLSGDWR